MNQIKSFFQDAVNAIISPRKYYSSDFPQIPVRTIALRFAICFGIYLGIKMFSGPYVSIVPSVALALLSSGVATGYGWLMSAMFVEEHRRSPKKILMCVVNIQAVTYAIAAVAAIKPSMLGHLNEVGFFYAGLCYVLASRFFLKLSVSQACVAVGVPLSFVGLVMVIVSVASFVFGKMDVAKDSGSESIVGALVNVFSNKESIKKTLDDLAEETEDEFVQPSVGERYEYSVHMNAGDGRIEDGKLTYEVLEVSEDKVRTKATLKINNKEYTIIRGGFGDLDSDAMLFKPDEEGQELPHVYNYLLGMIETQAMSIKTIATFGTIAQQVAGAGDTFKIKKMTHLGREGIEYASDDENGKVSTAIDMTLSYPILYVVMDPGSSPAEQTYMKLLKYSR